MVLIIVAVFVIALTWSMCASAARADRNMDAIMARKEKEDAHK